jgi:hypothetical protein
VVEDGNEPAQPLVVGLAVVSAEVEVVIGEVFCRRIGLDRLGDPAGPGRGPDLHIPKLVLAGRESLVERDGGDGKLPVLHPVARADDTDGFFRLDMLLLVFLGVTHKWIPPSRAACGR